MDFFENQHSIKVLLKTNSYYDKYRKKQIDHHEKEIRQMIHNFIYGHPTMSSVFMKTNKSTVEGINIKKDFSMVYSHNQIPLAGGGSNVSKSTDVQVNKFSRRYSSGRKSKF